MTDILDLIDSRDRRISIVRPGPVQPDSAGCVLLWVQRAQRAHGNLAANLAIDLANKLGLPVVAAFCLVDRYPRATLRAYQFMIEGLSELPTGFARRNVGWVFRAGDPKDVLPGLARELNAAAVVSDMAPTREARQWKADVGSRLTVPFLLVDTDVVVPTAQFDKLEWAPRTIRRKILPLLNQFLIPTPEPVAVVRPPRLRFPDLGTVLADLAVDRSVLPSPRFTGGQAEARRRLGQFIDHRLANYDRDRNRADIDGTTGLSPYLHFGQISPIEVALAARQALPEPGGAAIDSFLNELIVQRELCVNFALHEPNYDRYQGIPDWGRATLDEHRADPRPHLYDRETLASGATHDRLWNAAQRQMVVEGYMPNRLRMYWSKQLLYWTPDPETAFDVAVGFNDRYFIDGRDPNGYGGIAWAIGGRHDRPFPPRKPVLGLIRPMGIRAMQKHFDVDTYVTAIESRYGPT